MMSSKKPKRLMLLSLLFVATNSVLAVDIDKKLQAIPQLESAFAGQPSSITTKILNKQVNWQEAGIDLKINNQWQLSISSLHNIQLKQIAICIDGVTVVNLVDLKLKPSISIKYMFSDINFNKQIQSIVGSYKLVGIVNQVASNDYLSYQKYAYQVIPVTLTWIDEQNNYNEAIIRFMMVLAK